MAAEPPILQAPFLAPSTSSKNTPPIQGPAPPITPKQHHSLLNTLPHCPSAVRTMHHPSEPEPKMPGKFED
jgi:hypothetical protein